MTTKLFIEHPAPRQRCIIAALQPGDRFFFVTDSKRVVWEVQPVEQKKTWKYGGHTFAAGIKVKNDRGEEKYCLNKTEVIYLRHAV